MHEVLKRHKKETQNYRKNHETIINNKTKEKLINKNRIIEQKTGFKND